MTLEVEVLQTARTEHSEAVAVTTTPQTVRDHARARQSKVATAYHATSEAVLAQQRVIDSHNLRALLIDCQRVEVLRTPSQCRLPCMQTHDVRQHLASVER